MGLLGVRIHIHKQRGSGGGWGGEWEWEGERQHKFGLSLGMFDRRPQPPRDGCGDNGSVRGVYEADGGLGHVKIGTTSTNLDKLFYKN